MEMIDGTRDHLHESFPHAHPWQTIFVTRPLSHDPCHTTFVVTRPLSHDLCHTTLTKRPPPHDPSHTTLTSPYVATGFTIVAATGPATGVVCGGLYIDGKGGYNGISQRIVTFKILWIFAVIATACGIAAASLRGGSDMGPFYVVVVLLWNLLAWGGALVPALTGVMLSVLPVSVRTIGSGLAQAMFNVLGFGAGTLVPGLFMSFLNFSDKVKEIRWGMALLFSWALLGVLFLSFMIIHQIRERNRRIRVVKSRLQDTIEYDGDDSA